MATCSGSPPWDAQATANCSSPQPSESKPPELRNGTTWNGLAQDRQYVNESGSRAAPTSSSPAPTTAACTRCSDSVSSPRVTATSSSYVFITSRKIQGPQLQLNG